MRLVLSSEDVPWISFPFSTFLMGAHLCIYPFLCVYTRYTFSHGGVHGQHIGSLACSLENGHMSFVILSVVFFQIVF